MTNAHADRKEIASLDGWRAVAIGIVAFSHAGLGHIIPGGLGVTIFFFLSGYLITTLLAKEFAANSTINIPHFYLRRLFRLTPPLLLTLVLAYMLTYAGILAGHATWTGFFAQLLYFANYFSLFFAGNEYVPYGTGVFWSLAVEEHFYFVFPALFVLMLHKAERRHIPLYLAGLCLLVLAWRCYLVMVMHVSADRTYFASDTRIDSILYGCILATLPLSAAWREKLAQARCRLIAVAAGAVLLLLTLGVRNDVFRETLRYSLQGLALIPLFYYSVHAPRSFPFRLLNLAWVKKTGVYSYSIYLSHHILWTNLELVIDNAFLRGLLTLAGAWVFAMLVDRFIDGPLRAVRARFR